MAISAALSSVRVTTMLALRKRGVSPWIVLGFGVVLAFLTAYPLLMVFWGSVLSDVPGFPSHFTLEGYQTVFSSRSVYTALWNTLWLSIIRSVLAIGLAVFLAWIVTRTDTPYRGFLEVLIMIKFFVPILPLVLAWILLASPRTGFINVLIKSILPIEQPLFNIFSYWGIVWVSVIGWTSLLFIIIVPAFRGMDASMEESSRMSGASNRTTLFRITLPLMLPAILGAAFLAFLRMMESFEIELFLGTPAKIYVLSTKVYAYVYETRPSQYNTAMALSSIFLVLAFLLIASQWKLLSGKQFTTISGRGYAARVTPLGRWRYVTCGFVILYVLISTFLPLAVLVFGTFMRVAGFFDTPNPYTLFHYERVLNDPILWKTLRNTFVVAVTAALVGTAVSGFVSYVVMRTNFTGRKVLDLLAWLPFAVPSVVLSFGLFWMYSGGLPIILYGTLGVLIIALFTRSLPIGTRTLQGSMAQISKELEEASRAHGASWLRTFVRIMLPLAWPAFVSCWLIIFSTSLRDLSTVVLLYGPDSRILSTTIWEYWSQGGMAEEVSIFSLLLLALVVVPLAIERLLLRRGAAVA